jgi:branched-subunit amino acid aminotransferase/4-amino-4-deoxychorismate lyase
LATVFLNGRFVSAEEARVSAFDAGLQHGVGLFETMLARMEDGRAEVERLGPHLDRLVASAHELGLAQSLRQPALAEAVARTVEEAARSTEGLETERWRVRLTITGGDLNLLERPRAAGQPAITPTVLIAAHPAVRYPDEMFDRGVSVVVAEFRVNPLDPLAGHKTLNYWGRLRELQRAGAARAGEALVLQVSNHIAGGCVSNLFAVTDGVLLTPVARGEEGRSRDQEPRRTIADQRPSGKGVYLPSPVLPGITRAAVLDAARELGIAAEKRMMTIDDVLRAEELFLTNSSWGVLPVVSVEKHAIGLRTPGDTTRRIARAIRGEQRP